MNDLQMTISACLIAVTLSSLPAPVAADDKATSQITRSERIEDLKDVLKEATSRTLVVFDIDDTLLTSESFFGSDYWYEWQKGLKPGDSGYVPCKFDVIAINLELGAQRPVEPTAVELVNSVKLDMMYLTARNPGYRPATERELKRAGYQLPKPISNEVDGSMFQLSDSDPNKPRPVTYFNGIYMVSGLGKGEALAKLLKK